MREIRVLFTGVGRRIELLQSFKEAALRSNVALKIFGADFTGTAPALSYCDFTRKVRGMKEEGYIEELVRICHNDRIDLLIPTIDTDLLVLSNNVSLFGNTKVLISSPDKIQICRDKNKTANFFKLCGCDTPETVNDWNLYTGEYPCFIKPKDGSSSINAFRVENAEELELYAQQVQDYIVQPYIEGTEYTVDVFCDFSGKPVYITPRVRLQVRAGEVLKTKIVMDERIVDETRSIIEKFKPVGPITLQLIRQNSTNRDYFIEINPRFGGGAPLSMKAGARSADALLQIMLGQTINDTFVEDGAVYSRFDQSVCVSNGEVRQPIKGVVFDLDDTLYDEKQYVATGFRAIAEYLGENTAFDDLWNYFEAGKPAVDEYLKSIGRPEEKEKCLQLYREHFPSLSLNSGAKELIDALRNRGIKVGIITDGRPEGQRNKILALGLNNIVDDIIITDELGGEQFRKPCDIAFRIMQRRWLMPFEQMIYIGDNTTKDFQAPRQLGMNWACIKNPNSLYHECVSDIETHDFTELITMLLG